MILDLNQRKCKEWETTDWRNIRKKPSVSDQTDESNNKNRHERHVIQKDKQKKRSRKGKLEVGRRGRSPRKKSAVPCYSFVFESSLFREKTWNIVFLFVLLLDLLFCCLIEGSLHFMLSHSLLSPLSRLRFPGWKFKLKKRAKQKQLRDIFLSIETTTLWSLKKKVHQQEHLCYTRKTMQIHYHLNCLILSLALKSMPFYLRIKWETKLKEDTQSLFPFPSDEGIIAVQVGLCFSRQNKETSWQDVE